MKRKRCILLLLALMVVVIGCNNLGGYRRVENIITREEYDALTIEEKEELEEVLETINFDPNRTLNVINEALGSSISDARKVAGALIRVDVRGVIRAKLYEPEQGYTYRFEVESEDNKVFNVLLTFPRWSWQDGKTVSIEAIIDSETGENLYNDGHVPQQGPLEPPDLSTFEFDVEKTVQVIQDATNIDRNSILEVVYWFPRYNIKGAVSAELVEDTKEKLVSVKIKTEDSMYYIVNFWEYLDRYLYRGIMDVESGEMLTG